MDLEFAEQGYAETGASIRRIASSRHHNASDTGPIVPRVERIPPRTFGPVQIHFEPCGKIHRRRVWGNADVSEVARSIARGNVRVVGDATYIGTI
jgi:hypothetical protein